MQTESFEGGREREVLASLIWDEAVLASAVTSFGQSASLFRSDLSNYIVQWAVCYYQKYHKAPGDDIGLLPAELSEKDSALSGRLASLIESLPKPTSNNSARLLDLAVSYFEKVQIERLADFLRAKITRDDTQGCVDAINSFSRITSGVTHGVNPLTDDAALKAAFDDNTAISLLKFKNEDSRQFFGDTFSRSSFVVINASEKAGKSSLLLEFALMAVYQGCKVAYFEAGDMSQPQVFRRIYQRIAKHPRRAGTVKIPKSISVNAESYGKDAQIDVQFKTVDFQEDMSWQIADEACKKWRIDLSEKGINWKFSAHPQNLTVPGIVTILDEWERVDGFIPDFIIIDYADILVPVIKINEFRHQINDTFSRLRGLSLDRKCCVLTATQASAGAWDADIMTRQFLSEDKRKAAHPTAILGLTASQEERASQVAKLNYLVRRDDVCDESACLYLAQSLAICSPMVKTYFPTIHCGYVPPSAEDDDWGGSSLQQITSDFAAYSNNEFSEETLRRFQR